MQTNWMSHQWANKVRHPAGRWGGIKEQRKRGQDNWHGNITSSRPGEHGRGAVLRPSILLQYARDRVATAAETVTVSRLSSAMSVKQRK